MIYVIESLDQVGMLILSDLSRQECSTYTTSQQEFDVPDSPTGHGEEKGFCRQKKNTRWRQVTRCVGHEIALLPEYAGKINTCSHLRECAVKPEHVFNTGRDKGQAIHHDQNMTLAEELIHSTEKGADKLLRSNSDRHVEYTAEGSKTSQSSTC